MSIRFAAPVASLRARTRPSSTTLAFPRPANDNAKVNAKANANGFAKILAGVNDTHAPLDPLNDTILDTKLAAALRHFGAHGLAAAGQAHAEARKAFAEGDEAQFARWRDICSALDRRLARSLPNLRDIARAR